VVRPDDDKTRSGVEQRSPAIDALLEFDRQLYIALSVKAALSRALCESGTSPEEIEILTDKVLSHWDSTERAVVSMDACARTDEQDLIEQSRRLLGECEHAIGNVLSSALDRIGNAALQARVRHQVTKMQATVSAMQPEAG
jgi:hypothetical protein